MATDEATSKAIEGSSTPQRLPTPAERRASSHAGTTDTDQLVSDIEKTRAELAETIDAIVDRVSPKKVVERGKQQAREGVADATAIVKEHATTAAGVVREKATTATEAVKTAVAQVKEKAAGSSDSDPVRSPLSPATSVAIGSASPVSSSEGASAMTGASAPSPLPAGTTTVDVGELPPPEPAATTGSLADAAEAGGTTVEPAGSELPARRPLPTSSSPSSSVPPVPPVYAGAGVAALVAALLLLLRRRRSSRRRR